MYWLTNFWFLTMFCFSHTIHLPPQIQRLQIPSIQQWTHHILITWHCGISMWPIVHTTISLYMQLSQVLFLLRLCVSMSTDQDFFFVIITSEPVSVFFFIITAVIMLMCIYSTIVVIVLQLVCWESKLITCVIQLNVSNELRRKHAEWIWVSTAHLYYTAGAC